MPGTFYRPLHSWEGGHITISSPDGPALQAGMLFENSLIIQWLIEWSAACINSFAALQRRKIRLLITPPLLDSTAQHHVSLSLIISLIVKSLKGGMNTHGRSETDGHRLSSKDAIYVCLLISPPELYSRFYSAASCIIKSLKGGMNAR